jgi:hypothetical protein
LRESSFFYNLPLTAAAQESAGECDETYRSLSAQITTF